MSQLGNRFVSFVRASEALCAREAMLLPVGRVWNGLPSSWAARRGAARALPLGAECVWETIF